MAPPGPGCDAFEYLGDHLSFFGLDEIDQELAHPTDVRRCGRLNHGQARGRDHRKHAATIFRTLFAAHPSTFDKPVDAVGQA